MKPRISAIIHTSNEEANIANAIRSVVPWVMIDMYSEDRIASISCRFGSKGVLARKRRFGKPSGSILGRR